VDLTSGIFGDFIDFGFLYGPYPQTEGRIFGFCEKALSVCREL
jgi:hypothetical protein